jgi:hypothetical protein
MLNGQTVGSNIQHSTLAIQHSTSLFPRHSSNGRRIYSVRKILLPILLLQAVSAFAQPTISPEIASGPVPFSTFESLLPAPAIAMAKDRTGVAIAWQMSGAGGDRISVVRLDATGHFIGQVQTIAASSDFVYALAPSIAAAPRGDGFTLAWIEIPAAAVPVTRAVYCRLDRDLKPSEPATLIVTRQPAPAIVRSGKTTWISAGASAWELRDDGSLSAPLNAGMTATDMTVATDFPQIVAIDRTSTSFLVCPPGCGTTSHFPVCGCPFVPITTVTYSLQFTSLYSVTSSKRFDFVSDAAPAVGSNGHDVAVIWFQGVQQHGGAVMMSDLLPPSFANFPIAVNQPRVIGTFGADSGPTRPDIAGDGERYVVVWRTATKDGSHDIAGASIDREGNVVPLSIATSADDERDPSVSAVGDGRFLVAYDKLGNGERRIAGRFVTFAGRTHAVR